MSDGVKGGDARVLSAGQSSPVQMEALRAASVDEERIYAEHGTIGATAKAVVSIKPTVHRIFKLAGVDARGTTR